MPDEPVKPQTKQTIQSGMTSKAATAVKADIKKLVTQDATNPTNWRSYKPPHDWCAR
jgi:hypothetical protein